MSYVVCEKIYLLDSPLRNDGIRRDSFCETKQIMRIYTGEGGNESEVER